MNENELLDLIGRIGVLDYSLPSRIRTRAALGFPYFTVDTSLHYGEDVLKCRLYITHEGDQYNLEKYEAILRQSLVHQYPLINGVDTRLLDERMGTIAWSQVLEEPDRYHLLPENVPTFLADLWRLSENNDPDGKAMQAFLLSKHFNTADWGLQPYLYTLLTLPGPYMSVSDFSSEFPNAHLCYYTLSGTKERLEKQLVTLGIEAGLYLERALSRNEDAFTITQYKFLEEGIVRCDVPFSKYKDNNYMIQDYTARLCPFPEIEHCIYKGINTRELEQRMRRTDWVDEVSHYIYIDAEPRFSPPVEQIISELQYILPGDSQGAMVASQLQLKYWLQSPDFIGMIDNAAWEYLDHLPARETTIPLSIPTEAAYNLLCGRPVYMGDDKWMKFDLTLRNGLGYVFEKVAGLSPEDIVQMLTAQNIDSHKIPEVTQSILRGSKVKTTIDENKTVYLQPGQDPNIPDINIVGKGKSLNASTADVSTALLQQNHRTDSRQQKKPDAAAKKWPKKKSGKRRKH